MEIDTKCASLLGAKRSTEIVACSNIFLFPKKKNFLFNKPHSLSLTLFLFLFQSWTAATLTGGSLSSGLCVAFSQEQSRWVVGGQSGTVSLASAADGATLSFSGVAGSQNVLSRVNGVVWSGTPLNIWVAAGQQGNGGNTGPIAWSTDAVTWTNIGGGNSLFNIATGVAWSPARGLFIATGQAALSGVAFR